MRTLRSGLAALIAAYWPWMKLLWRQKVSQRRTEAGTEEEETERMQGEEREDGPGSGRSRRGLAEVEADLLEGGGEGLGEGGH